MPSEQSGSAAPLTVHDAHCHFLSGRFYQALGREKYGADAGVAGDRISGELGWELAPTSESLAARWVSELDRHHVSRAALIASVPGDEDSVAEAVAHAPARFVGFFALNPADEKALQRARRAFSELGLRCVCLFPAMHRYRLDDDCVTALFEIAAEYRAAVFAHCGYLSIEARTKLGLRSSFDMRLGDPL